MEVVEKALPCCEVAAVLVLRLGGASEFAGCWENGIRYEGLTEIDLEVAPCWSEEWPLEELFS